MTLSRRKFLKSVGLGTGAALMANAGLPLALAGSVREVALAGHSPDVELLCGDVVGFALSSDEWEGAFGWVTFKLHRAHYEGEDVFYIRTDASDQAFAEENKLVHVPLLNAALATESAVSPVYTFTNGAEHQHEVVGRTPSDGESFSSAWQVHTVTFNGEPTMLTSVAEIEAAADAGDVTIEALNVVVNYPIVKWPDGELQEDTEKDSYLGTGPLVSPVDTDAMRVTFKLHECYPGSRYIVTDTSAVPMAPMMSIAASGPTQQLMDVGATDEIWVFANGIPGSGVMGFQPAIFDNSAGSPVWSPFWNHFTVEWVDESEARVLTNSTEIRELIDAGTLNLYNGVPDSHPNGFVVNCPVPIKAANTFHADMDDMM